ncbi:MGH1-like glycoside hydrolase domain-containing protein [Tropicimonas marinistellae]|uniref:MGH1-like glycoside hydrolase domain-containing protein n=1 Tax=Tropicimonas marinistellae TaxID=1739787 RepID=UPI00083218E0|nr:hypothetical protein [Tropicimonas marinistellae]
MGNDADQAAREVLRDNDRGTYTVPTDNLYPFQWNWDSCFAAWGFSTFDVPRAWVEIETLLANQWENGMMPHMVFHDTAPGYFPGPEVWGTGRTPPTSGITQPPVAATLARAVYKADPDYGRTHMASVFGILLGWHRWFMTERVERGMVAVTHPWETGRDNAVDWDAAMGTVDTSGVGEYKRRDLQEVAADQRPKKAEYDKYLAMVYFGRECGWDEAVIREAGPFRVADVGMTFILLRACRDLLAMARDLGEPAEEIAGWIATLEAGARNHWNPDGEYFDSIDLRTGAFAGALTNASFLCWYAGIDDARMLGHLERQAAALTYLVPSLDPDHPEFDALRYWRGPVWGIVNTLIGLGLAETGHDELARRVRKDSRRLIEASGFFEYFSPLDGTPAGGGHFSWTAAVWLAWASPAANERIF